ncbi:MAG: 16S rRNA (cytidine(1402)-2'-O)-methyltransferase [Leptospiraceae bacterium]|nr:16S rRNA (cytidine(1402)-2'-O)-methyltransferase [Leptospiraceae bacterium]MCP5512264.1 16S rRNA (cytidine(1402)-2'-O)-methyltransferase [Leptospiraceae bacterium]
MSFWSFSSGMQPLTGKLYIVGTPIGNLEDMSFRAVSILKESDLILCENPKNSKKLLQKYEIETSYQPLYASTREEGFDWILKKLSSGESISYISDAGTPGISDPGNRLVRYVRSHGFSVVPIPGVSALSTILSVSGAQNTPSLFLGFPGEKKSKTKKKLEEWKAFEGVLIFYESVHRIQDTLDIAREIFPGAEILVGRELTKIYEEMILWRPGEEKPKFSVKGEFTVLINNFEKKIAKENLLLVDTKD